jgi:hypothetical protein
MLVSALSNLLDVPEVIAQSLILTSQVTLVPSGKGCSYVGMQTPPDDKRALAYGISSQGWSMIPAGQQRRESNTLITGILERILELANKHA